MKFMLILAVMLLISFGCAHKAAVRRKGGWDGQRRSGWWFIPYFLLAYVLVGAFGIGVAVLLGADMDGYLPAEYAGMSAPITTIAFPILYAVERWRS